MNERFSLQPPLPAWQKGTTLWARETRESPLPIEEYGTLRARVREKKKMCNLRLLYERERERESIQIFGTTKLFAIFFSPLDVKESNAMARLTPLLYKAQTLA